jgi:diketogulonate reductase-like aldo/keto reductase
MKTLTDVYVLNNGVKMPKIGFGTWQIPNGAPAYDSVTLMDIVILIQLQLTKMKQV